MLSRADDIEAVGLAVSGVNDYKSYFDAVGLGQGGVGGGPGNMAGGSGSDSKSLEDMFYQKEMEISKIAFTRQFTHGVIYAWIKLREQVRSNISCPYFANINTGDTKHHLDSGVHRTEPEGEDRQLHQCLLRASSMDHDCLWAFRGASEGRTARTWCIVALFWWTFIHLSSFCGCYIQLEACALNASRDFACFSA